MSDSSSRELDVLAAVVHAGAVSIHGYGAWRGHLSPHLAGAAIALHGLSLAYNVPRGNWFDSLAHVAGIFAALSGDRAAHATMVVYDGVAASKHALRAIDGCAQ